MEINEQNFNDLLSNDDVQIDEDINEEDIQNEDLLDLSDFNHSESDDNDDNDDNDDHDGDDNNEDKQSDFIAEYLKGFGIEDMSKIQMEDENGEIQEVDFNTLSEDEKLNIFKELSDPGYSDYEKSVITYLRQNNATLDDVIEYYKQQAVEEYLSEHPEDVHQKVYDIDQYTDDEIYLADLKNKYPEFTDEELTSKLDSAKLNSELFEKEVAAIRASIKANEDEEAKRHETEEAQNYQEFQNNLQSVMASFTQIELDPDDKEQDALALDVTDEDRADMMRYLVERDKDGKSQLIRDLEDPNALIQLAYYRTRERDNLTGLTRYWKNELANERKEKAKLQKELDKYKNKEKNSFVVSPENKDNKTGKKTRSIMDIYG